MGTCSQLYHEGNIPIMCITRLLPCILCILQGFYSILEGNNSNITSYKMDKATLKKKDKKTQQPKKQNIGLLL